jgi:hypothetical protein
MCIIGLRSGKIRAGLYRCGDYRIERQPRDYWHVTMNGEFRAQFPTMTEAYEWCRYPRLRSDAA